MRPVDPPCAVWHPGYGHRVVVALDIPEAQAKAEELTFKYGAGTWTISLEGHLEAIAEMNLYGRSNVIEDPIWIPWKDLSIPAEG